MIHPIEHTTVQSISDHTLERINVAIDLLKSKSPYYKKMLNELGIDRISSFEDFEKIPTTTKNQFQKNNNDFLCSKDGDIAEWTTTSGTLGSPVTFGLTALDLQRLASNEARSLHLMGCTPEDRIQLQVTMDKRFIAGLAYYLGAQEYGCATIRVGSGSPGLQLDSMVRFKPSVLVAVPSFLVKVLEYGIEHGIDVSALSFKKVLCIGEPVRDKELQPNNLAKRIKSLVPNVTLYSTYASTEMCTAMTECAAGAGGHIPSNLAYVEVLNDEGTAVENEVGEVTITTFGVEGMPLLRYRTGDLAQMYIEPCSCGLSSPRIGPILGRKQQMIKYKGTTVYPQAIFDTLDAVAEVEHYLLELNKNNIDMDDLIVYYSSSSNTDELEDKLKEVFQSNIRIKPNLVFKSNREIIGMKFPPNSRKPIKILDKR